MCHCVLCVCDAVGGTVFVCVTLHGTPYMTLYMTPCVTLYLTLCETPYVTPCEIPYVTPCEILCVTWDDDQFGFEIGLR